MTRRCSICALDWPDDKELYSRCPECEEPTSLVSNITPMDADEAHSLKAQADFKRFYEQWDLDHDPARLLSNEKAT